MPCTGRFSEAWQYSQMWCVTPSAIRTGVDDGAGAAVAFLTDSQADFVDLGFQANEGMLLYNLTEDTEGPITAVTATTLTATGVTWTDGDSYRAVALDGNQISAINVYLDLAAGDVHMALAAVGACDCTLSGWGANLLAKLNIIDAVIYHNCTCANPEISDEQRAMYATWIDAQFELIRTGKVDVCQGATGSGWPTVDYAEQATTEFAARDIIYNAYRRSR